MSCDGDGNILYGDDDASVLAIDIYNVLLFSLYT